MSISLQADSNLSQGYILVNGTAAATIKQDGSISAPSLSANSITGNLTGNVVGTVTGSLSGVASQATTLVTASASNAPVYGCRAWVNFDGTGTISTNQTIRSAGNVSTVFKNRLGDYTVNFIVPMANANYSLAATHGTTGIGTNGLIAYELDTANRTVSSVRIGCSNNELDQFSDTSAMNVLIFGN
jgi:hypothetical protein